jgi:hypothetical protein
MGTLSASYFEKGKAYLLLNEEEDNEDERNKRQGNKMSEMFPAADLLTTLMCFLRCKEPSAVVDIMSETQFHSSIM